MKNCIKIIDLFAGPGGLGEGFINCEKDSPFEIAMSVEFEPNAHKTLTHRAFYRKLDSKGKGRFLDYVQTTDLTNRELILEQIKDDYIDSWNQAKYETMGKPHALGNNKIWGKLKAGLPITDEDRKDTPDQEAISKRVKQVKIECKKKKIPLLVIGGPPCQSYSSAGRNRVRDIKVYSPDEDQRFFLYREYCRVLAEAEPDMFILENVRGILSAKLANKKTKIFPIILEALKHPHRLINKKNGASYRLYSLVVPPNKDKQYPEYEKHDDYNIKANLFGVPQLRNRVIILGIRKDHGKINSFMQPTPDNKEVSISEIIGTLPKLRSGISNRKEEKPNTNENWKNDWCDSQKSLLEKLTGERFDSTRKAIKNQRPMDSSIKVETGNEGFVSSTSSGFSKTFLESKNKDHILLRKWIEQPRMKGFANHSTKSHQLLDRTIYMFTAAWAKAHSNESPPSPTSINFPGFLAPDHSNWKSGDHVDRFRCLESSKTAYTITSHLKKDGHAFIHYDISQNRAITPREAARIQTFPDDYFFEGSQGSQYQQVGNAVPSFLAKQIAKHLLKIVREKNLWD